MIFVTNEHLRKQNYMVSSIIEFASETLCVSKARLLNFSVINTIRPNSSDFGRFF